MSKPVDQGAPDLPRALLRRVLRRAFLVLGGMVVLASYGCSPGPSGETVDEDKLPTLSVPAG